MLADADGRPYTGQDVLYREKGVTALERLPESLARMTEALWLQSLDEARERTKASLIGASPSQRETAALQGKMT